MLDSKHIAAVDARKATYDADWDKLVATWREGIERVKSEVAAVEEWSQNHFPAWNDPAWNPYEFPETSPAGLRIGQFHVPLSQIPQAIPDNPRLRALTPDSFDLPAFVEFPDKISLLLKAADEGRGPAVPGAPTGDAPVSDRRAPRARFGSRSSTRSASGKTSRRS